MITRPNQGITKNMRGLLDTVGMMITKLSPFLLQDCFAHNRLLGSACETAPKATTKRET